jgi:excisionase family DNA binding protein
MTEKLYSLREVAKILRVSERTVFRYIHAKKLGATKIGYWRISEGNLKQFLDSRANISKRHK